VPLATEAAAVPLATEAAAVALADAGPVTLAKDIVTVKEGLVVALRAELLERLTVTLKELELVGEVVLFNCAVVKPTKQSAMRPTRARMMIFLSIFLFFAGRNKKGIKLVGRIKV